MRWIALTGFFLVSIAAEATAKPSVPTAILVDKKTNTLKLTEWVDGEYRILKTYHTTTGQVIGDKEEEGDLKTPEGVYRFTSLLRPPVLAKKFGVMAFYMDFPNTFDKLAGRTGFDIMLHATDQPERLKRNFDSEGCIVVSNDDLEDIKPHIELGLTPILVFSNLEDKYLKPAANNPRLVQWFKDWIRAWESKDIEAYISNYHSDFTGKGHDRAGWKAYKAALNRKYDAIEVNPSLVQYFWHPKYTLVMFKQKYQSTFKGGRAAFVSEGTKILYVAEERGQLRIIAEDFTPRMW